MRTALFVLALLVVTAFVRAAEAPLSDPRELAHALKSANPGDVIILPDGRWNDVEMKIHFDATAEKPLTIRAQTPGNVVFTGASRLRITGSHITVDGLLFTDGGIPSGHVISIGTDDTDARNCRLTNCAVINYNLPPGSSDKSTYYISMFGTDNRVDHCYLRGKIDHGPMFVVWVQDKPNNHRIDHNFFAGRSPLGKNGGETMRIGTSQVSMNDSRSIVEFNYFEDCSGESEIISNKSCENIYRNNTFVNCKGGLTLRHGNRCTVENNFFFGNDLPGTGGIRIVGEDHRIVGNHLQRLAGERFESALPIVNGIPNSALNEYFRVKRAIIAYNELIDCKQSITFGVGAGARNRVEPPVDCVFAHNKIRSEHGPLVRFEDRSINTVWIDNEFSGAESGLMPAELERRQPTTDISFLVDVAARLDDANRKPLTPTDVGPDWSVPTTPLPTTNPT